MHFEEERTQRLEGDLCRIEHDEHHLGVIGVATTNLSVGGMLQRAAGVTGRGGENARLLPEFAFDTPETARWKSTMEISDERTIESATR